MGERLPEKGDSWGICYLSCCHQGIHSRSINNVYPDPNTSEAIETQINRFGRIGYMYVAVESIPGALCFTNREKIDVLVGRG